MSSISTTDLANSQLKRSFTKVLIQSVDFLNREKNALNEKFRTAFPPPPASKKADAKPRYATHDWHAHALELTLEKNKLRQMIMSQQKV